MSKSRLEINREWRERNGEGIGGETVKQMVEYRRETYRWVEEGTMERGRKKKKNCVFESVEKTGGERN